MKATILIVLVACLLPGCIVPFAFRGRIVHTEDNIYRREVYRNPALYMIGAINTVYLNGARTTVVAGTDGAAYLNVEYDETDFVEFAVPMITPIPVDVEGDGDFEFMSRGGGWSQVSLLSADGQHVWTFGEEGEPTPNEMAAGDLDGDGILEFIVATNAGGLYVLDAHGSAKELLERSGHYVEAADVDGDGDAEIIQDALDYDGHHIEIREGDGELVSGFPHEPGYFQHLLWRAGADRTLVPGRNGRDLLIYELSGKVVSRLRMPRGTSNADDIQPVRSGGTTRYAVAVRAPYAYHIGYLYIFTGDGKTIHKEVFTQRVETLLAVADPERPGNEVLLAGSGTQVVEYRFD